MPQSRNITGKTLDNSLTKRCRACYKMKSVSEYSRKRKSYDSQCKECKNKKRRMAYHMASMAKRKYQKKAIRIVDEVFWPRLTIEDDWKAVEKIFLNLAIDMIMEINKNGKERRETG